MISPPLTRADLAAQTGCKGKELTQRIREMKKAGSLIQRKVSAGPMTAKKKVVFNIVATNLNLEV
jgi:hypothetical protein